MHEIGPCELEEIDVVIQLANRKTISPMGIVRDVEVLHIVFCEDASNIVSHPSRSRKTSVHVISVRIGDHCYYGLCDIGASSSAIPFELYREIMHEIGPCELEEIDVVI
jgi:hypothetical protein